MNGPFGFPETLWTHVIEASGTSSQARERLAGLYRKPVKAYFRYLLRFRPNADDEAEDLTQEFFCREWAKLSDGGSEAVGVIRRADRNKGRFRDFLMASLRNFWKERCRHLRDGEMVSPADDDEWNRLVPCGVDHAEKELCLSMVRDLIATALEEVEVASISKGQQLHFRIFIEHYLPEPGSGLDEGWEAIARRCAIKDGKTARNMAETVVRRFRRTLCAQLGLPAAAGEVPQEILGVLADMERNRD